ncbi:MAG: hypothetical protein V4676_04995 [Bacteroidota bacterium]
MPKLPNKPRLVIWNEAEIHFKAAKNKRLHVELALIKLCYLQQAIQLTGNGSGIDKKKIVDGAKSVAFRNIQPIAIPVPDTAFAKKITSAIPVKTVEEISQKNPEAKLIIHTTEEPVSIVAENKEPYHAAPATTEKAKTKLGSLETLRQKLGSSNTNVAASRQPITQPTLDAAWLRFIESLKASKNPAWQSFEVAQLQIIDDNSFKAIVGNNINQKFLELERNKASDFLKQALSNPLLQLIVVLIEGEKEIITEGLPLSSKEQYQKMIEQYPLVKELKDRLRMDLDY